MRKFPTGIYIVLSIFLTAPMACLIPENTSMWIHCTKLHCVVCGV